MTRLRLASWQPTVAEGATRPVNIRALAPRRSAAAEPAEPARRYGWLALAVIGHIAAVVLLQPSQQPEKPVEKTPPMLVSLIAEPAPQPAVAKPEPVTEPTPPKVIPKKVVVRQTPKHESKPEPAVEPKPEPVSKPEVQQPVAQEQVAPAEEAPTTPPAPQVAKAEPAAAPEPQEPVVEPPRFGVAYLKNPPPEYPAVSRRIGEEGRVVLRVLVTVDGKPETVEIENGSGSKRLDDAALDAVKKWKFIPARRNNESVSAYVLVPLKFALNG